MTLSVSLLLLLLLLSPVALSQDSSPGPSDLPSLASLVNSGADSATRRAALESIARIFDQAGDAAAASRPNNVRKHEARLRARAALAAEYAASMRPRLDNGLESTLLTALSIEAIRSRLDALWDLRVDPVRVVNALDGALPTDTDYDVGEFIPELARYDRDGAAATRVLLELATSGDHRRRRAAQGTLYDMGVRARGAQEGLVHAFLRWAPSSRPKRNKPSVDLRDRIDLLQPLYAMGPAPPPLVRRVVAAIESNPEEHRYLMGVLATLDPTGSIVAPLVRDRFFRGGDLTLGPWLLRWEPDPAPVVGETLRRMFEDPGTSLEAGVDALGDLGSSARFAAPALIDLYSKRPFRKGLDAAVLFNTQLRSKIRETLFKIEADPAQIFALVGPVLATEEDSWRLESLCDRLDGLKLAVPPLDDLVTTLVDHGTDLEAHRAAFLIGRHRAEAASAVPSLASALNRGSSSLRWVAARSLSKIGPGAASAIPDLVEALRDEREAAESRPVEGRRHRATRQGEVCAQLVKALGAIGPAAKDARPAMMAALKTVYACDYDEAYELFHEDFDRITPPERTAATVVEDPTLSVAASARWSADNRGTESRPFHAAVSRDPDGRFRLTLYDIRKPREFWPAAWTRAVFLARDAAGDLVATSEFWRSTGGPRQARTREEADLSSIRWRPVDLARAERLELAYDEGDDWIEVTVPNPFRK